MDHGILGYFAESARFARRVSIVTLTVGLVGLGALWIARTRPVHDALRKTVRFGYEGPDQYVRRITLQPYRGTGSEMRDVGRVQARGIRGSEPESRHGVDGKPRQDQRRLPTIGDSDVNVSRLVSRVANVPVIQSEDLVIVDLVRPVYPEAAREQGLEGRVKIQALIDTAGRVVDVQLMSNEGDTQFADAASEAVWKCRFRPYRGAGSVSEVYAVFRFSFRIH